ncbi:hypothetical protein ACOMHN_011825 [Nucella lapillus]
MSSQGDTASAKPTSKEKKNGKGNGHEIKLYYFPTSFSSQKVLLAAYEKGLQFQPHLVSLFHGQHMEPWYVKLNPEGTHVPVLVHGATVLNNPEEIIDYIDSLETDAAVSLVPDVDTPLGQSVLAVREQLNQVPVDILTYGVVFHPHLAPNTCQLPAAVQRSMRENFARRLQYLTHKATLHPDLRDAYLAKSQIAAQKYDIITDEEKVKGQLGQLDSIFQDVEKMLAAAYTEGAGARWLFGGSFTVADITLSILLQRLTLLGLQARLFPPKRCPHTHRYLTQLQARPAVQRIRNELGSLRLTLLWEDVKAASPLLLAAAGVGLAAGLAFVLARRLH